MTDDPQNFDAIKLRFTEIVRAVLGEPNWAVSTKEIWRYGHRGSLACNVAGPAIGTWFSHETGEGGGVLAFLGEFERLTDSAAQWIWLRERGFAERDRESSGENSGDNSNNSGKNARRIIACYQYVDENGSLLFEVVRFDPKDFRQRRPDGSGGWIWNLKGVARVPYHLDAIVRRTGETVFIVEGEKDADCLTAIGYLATTGPGGAGKWDKGWAARFAGREVVILPDNDEAGRKHAAVVAESLLGVAESVKIVALPGLAEKGDVSDWFAGGASAGEFEDVIDVVEPLRLVEDQPVVKIFGSGIPLPAPRRWLLGTNFCVGYLSGLTGPGGVGKTALRTLQLIALALGRNDLTEGRRGIVKRTRVLLVSLEDDEDELVRRVMAACLYYGIDFDELKPWLYFWCPRGLRFIEQGKFGEIETGALGPRLGEVIARHGIGLVSIDPLVKSHSANENDNAQMDLVAQEFLKTAHEHGAAADFVSHDRKGVASAGDTNRVRGASALVDASRLIKTLTRAGEKDLDLSNEAGDDRDYRRYVRLDDAKLNIAVPADQAVWFRLVNVNIGNGSEDYPSGDNVQTVERYFPADPFDKMTNTMYSTIFMRIRSGPAPAGQGEKQGRNELWMVNRGGKTWAGKLFEQEVGVSDKVAGRMLRDLINSGVLIVQEFKDRHGKLHPGVVVDEVKADALLSERRGRYDRV